MTQGAVLWHCEVRAIEHPPEHPLERDCERRITRSAVTSRLRDGRVDDLLRFLENAPEVRFSAEAFRVDLVDVFRAGGRAANHPLAVDTLMPPIGALFPGARSSTCTTGSPANSFSVNSLADKLRQLAFLLAGSSRIHAVNTGSPSSRVSCAIDLAGIATKPRRRFQRTAARARGRPCPWSTRCRRDGETTRQRSPLRRTRVCRSRDHRRTT